MPSRHFLGEQHDAIDGHVEDSSRRLDELDLGAGEFLPNLRRQTGGAGLVVSNEAVLNRHAHRRALCRSGRLNLVQS